MDASLPSMLLSLPLQVNKHIFIKRERTQVSPILQAAPWAHRRPTFAPKPRSRPCKTAGHRQEGRRPRPACGRLDSWIVSSFVLCRGPSSLCGAQSFQERFLPARTFCCGTRAAAQNSPGGFLRPAGFLCGGGTSLLSHFSLQLERLLAVSP